ncbi:DNA-binding domain-containing protein [Sulfuritalea sp.]|uniref:HvfC/BufC N-terminal domain-containing protein n=1 Tax=Sulfuritalea sp. TaxID=2480090 RepID=UPI00286D7C48|nr:DNA-binding domain-containing protein [Sulfuritalea sp.]
MNIQSAFADALLAPEAVCPTGLLAWNGSDPGRRFAVYRNNVMVSLIDALADSYPVTQELVGEEFFAAMARLFVQAQPPRSPVLALYGEGFADFIEAFPPAVGLPYLADVARLEMRRVQAWHAADAEPLTEQELARLLADASLPLARFGLQPSLGVLRSRHAVVSLWAAHQADDVAAALAQIAVDQAEAALVLRVGLEVDITRIGEGAAAFVGGLQQGLAFGAAAGQALAVEPEFDLAATLGMLIRGGGLCSASIPGDMNS